MTIPFFSVVITTYNRPLSLQRCVSGLESQTFDAKKFEVIVVDDGSSPENSDKNKKVTYSHEIQILQVEHRGPSRARNIGMKHAKGEFIVLMEDDVLPHRDYLEKAYGHLQSQNIDVLEGLTIQEGTQSSIRKYERESTLSFIPCNLILRRTVYETLGDYDEEFYDLKTGLYFREDAEYGFRIMDAGFKIQKVQDLIVEHPLQFNSLSSCFRHARRYYFDPLLYKKHPRRYLDTIEVKTILGIQIHRPMHLISWFSVAAGVVLCSAILISSFALASLAVSTSILLAVILRYKYQGKDVFRMYQIIPLLAFMTLPYVYLGALIQGCIRFKSYRCLF